VLALVPLVALAVLWSNHYLGVGAGHPAAMAALAAALPVGLGMVTRLLDKAGHETLSARLRNAVARVLKWRVLLVLYLALGVVALWTWCYPDFADAFQLNPESAMPTPKPPHPEAFRQQMVELVRAGRGITELARQFGAGGQPKEVVRVGQRRDLVEFGGAPHESVFRMAPGTDVLDMNFADAGKTWCRRRLREYVLDDPRLTKVRGTQKRGDSCPCARASPSSFCHQSRIRLQPCGARLNVSLQEFHDHATWRGRTDAEARHLWPRANPPSCGGTEGSPVRSRSTICYSVVSLVASTHRHLPRAHARRIVYRRPAEFVSVNRLAM